MSEPTYTFLPVVLPNYNVGGPLGLEAPGLGHAAFIMIDSAGVGTYYEFGRYNPDKNINTITRNPLGSTEGNIRELTIQTKFKFNADGTIDPTSLLNGLNEVYGSSKMYASDTGMASVTQFSITETQSKSIQSYVKNEIEQVNAGTTHYQILGKNCIQFVYDAASSAKLAISATQDLPTTSVPSMAFSAIRNEGKATFQYFGPNSWNKNWINKEDSTLGLTSDYMVDRLRQFAEGVTKTLQNHGLISATTPIVTTDHQTGLPIGLEYKASNGSTLLKTSLEKDGSLKYVEFNELSQKTRDVLLDSNGVPRALSTFIPDTGRVLLPNEFRANGQIGTSTFFDRNGSVSTFSNVREHLLNPLPIKDKINSPSNPAFTELSEKTRAALLNPNGPTLPAPGGGSQFINININPDPAAQTKFQNETQLRQDISNGFITNRPTHQVSFPGKELDDLSFTSSQMGSIATGGVRPGNTQIDPNPKPNKYLSENLRPIANVVLGPLGPLVNAVNAIVTNGLSASMTKNIFIDPIVLDLSGTGVKLTPINDGVLFDINNSGTQRRTGWTGKDTGLLVIDDGTGNITNASQLLSEYFGGQQGTNGGPGQTPFKDGFAALSSKDANNDLFIDANDPIWNKLKVWIDLNHNGLSEPGELKTLDELGITRFNLKATPAAIGELRDGNEIISKGTFIINGKEQEALAVNFIADPVSNTFKDVAGGTEITSAAGSITKKAYVSNSTTGEVLDANKLGVNNIYGGQGNDTLIAAKNGSWLTGGGGSNTYNGSSGDDVFVISASDNTANIHGNGGRDTAIIIGDEAVTLNMAQAGLTIAQGGRGDDVIRSGGQSGVFIKGGSGNQTLVGGGGNDVISGGSGKNVIVGGTGKAVIHAGPNGDLIYASDGGSIISAGGGSDIIYGRGGNDVFIAGRGDATIDGGGGTNIVEFHGSYSEYEIGKNGERYTVTDKVKGRDGIISFTNVQKLNFSDISAIDLTTPNALPVADMLRVDKNGVAIDRTQPHLISAEQLLANDHRLNSSGKLAIRSVSDAVGGTVVLTGAGDVLFTPDQAFSGVMSFKYDLVDAAGNTSASVLDIASGAKAPMRAVASLLTPEIPTDPLVSKQWYLSDINIFPVWKDYTGKGVRIGQFEPGGKFSVTPEIFNIEHPDLKPNVDKVWLETETQKMTLPSDVSNHATMVAGVMVAARNGAGGVGVAYNATLGGHYLANDGNDLSGLGRMVSYDIANNSWGFANEFALSNMQKGSINSSTALLTNMQYAAQNGRGGLGTVIVAAGGNDREKGGSAQGSLTSNNRFAIQVGAINAQSDLSTLQIGSKPFSNPGASLLVSAPGSNVVSTGQMVETEQGSTFGNSYSNLNGTSFATPIVSGIIANMLQANPNLGYRDVQTILALSARLVNDPSTKWEDNAARNWNGGGMHTSHDYGFGKVDALAAVRMAESWMTQNKGDNEFVVSGKSKDAALSASGGESITSFIDMQAGVTIEHVEVDFEAIVGRLGDLIVKLVSPDGTTSILLDRHGKMPDGVKGAGSNDPGNSLSGDFKYTFMTTHDWGERSQGRWTLQVSDAKSGLPVTLTSWGLRIYGARASADDTYYFTNEYKDIAAANPGRKTLDDAVNGTAGGRNTINASAVSGDVSINLATGIGQIAGTDLTIKTPGSIHNLIGGDGNDTLTAGTGNAILDGQRGNNILTGGDGKDFFVVHRRESGTDTIVNFDPAKNEKLDLVGFRGMTFSDLVLTQQGEDVLINPGSGQTILLKNQTVAAITADQFVFQDTFVAPAEYVGNGAIPAPIEGLGTIVLRGGALGVQYQGQPDGSQKASLIGTIYSHDSAASDTFVIEAQEKALNYANALRGFRHGVDKLDLRQLGITSIDDLIIEKVNRATINGLSQIHGVSVKSKSLGTEAAPVELIYLDAVDPAQVTLTDFILAEAAPDKAPVVKEPIIPTTTTDNSVPGTIPAIKNVPIDFQATPTRPIIFNPIKFEIPEIKYEPPKIVITPVRIAGGPIILNPGPVIADPSNGSVVNADGTTTKTSIAADGAKTEMIGRFNVRFESDRLLRTVITLPDGTRTEMFYKDSIINALERATTTFPDGTKSDTLFDFSGTRTTEITVRPDGYLIETTYDGGSDDRILSQVTTKPDGTKIATGKTNGNDETVRISNPDGSSVELTYIGQSDELRTKKTVAIDGTETIAWMGKSGKPTSVVVTKPNGFQYGILPDGTTTIMYDPDAKIKTKEVTTFAEDGTKTVTTTTDVPSGWNTRLYQVVTKPDGTRTERKFGKIRHIDSEVTTEPDGTVLNAVLDTVGRTLYHEVTKPDGSKYELLSDGATRVKICNAEGKLVSDVTKQVDGAETTRIYDKDGYQVTSSTVVHAADGTRIETTFGAFKRRVKEILTAPDGSRVETDYDSFGDPKARNSIDKDGTKVPLPLVHAALLGLNDDGYVDLSPPFGLDKRAADTKPQGDWHGDGHKNTIAWVGPQDPILTIDFAADGSAGSHGKINQNEEVVFSLWKTEEERQAEQGYDGKGEPFAPETSEAGIGNNPAKFLDLREAGWKEFRAWQAGARNMEAVPGEQLSIEQASMRLTDLMPSRESGRNFTELSAFAGNNQQGMMDGTRSFSADATLVHRSSLSA